jgi:hypothetical protein
MSKALAFSASAVPAILRLIADKAPATTLAELIADPSIGGHARVMTLGQFAAALASAGVSAATQPVTRSPVAVAAKGSKRAKRGARGNQAERTARSNDYDSAVLSEISAASEPVGAVIVRGKVGGSADEFRASVERLIAKKKVKKSGIAKGTRYRVA